MPLLLHGVTNTTTTAKASTTLDTDIIEGQMVKCVRCKRDVRAGDYDTHECSTLTFQSGGEDGIKGPEKTGFH